MQYFLQLCPQTDSHPHKPSRTKSRTKPCTRTYPSIRTSIRETFNQFNRDHGCNPRKEVRERHCNGWTCKVTNAHKTYITNNFIQGSELTPSTSVHPLLHPHKD